MDEEADRAAAPAPSVREAEWAVDRENPPGVLAQFYRAGMARADTWRSRLDATTNWAVVTTAAVITFAYGGGAAPHYVLLMALPFATFFLLMETRRYQLFNLWQRRIRAVHRFVVVPALTPEEGPTDEEIRRGRSWIARELGKSVPYLGLVEAAGYRIRRTYGPLITLVILAWVAKLWMHPTPAGSMGELVARAGVGVIPGVWVCVGIGLFFLAFVALAVAAPSEQMMGWSKIGAPIEQVFDEEGERTREERRRDRDGETGDARPPGIDP